MERLETMVTAQNEKLDKLEDLVYRIMHRSRVNFDSNPESPKYDEYQGHARQRTTFSNLKIIDPAQQESAELESPLSSPGRESSVGTSYHPIPSI